MMDCTPVGHILESFAYRTGMSWKIALLEWIDNAFGAKAQRVTVEIGKNGKDSYVLVEDDGLGTDAMHAFATLGEHVEHKKKDGISHYGIGSKDAALWVGKEFGRLKVRSVCGGMVRSCVFDWQELGRNNWRADDPDEAPAKPGDVGTRIEVSPAVPKLPSLEDLIEQLGYHYRPALRHGRQIVFKHRSLGVEPRIVPPWEPPPLEPGHIDLVIEVGGKKARLYVGVVAEGHSCGHRGITYFRDFRVIREASGKGCGNYNPAHVCGFVELDDKWRLNTNKDGFFGEQDLFDAVEQAAKPVLERAEQRGMQASSSEFATAIEGMLNSALAEANAKARRKPGKSKGTQESTGRGPRHTRAEDEQKGNTFPSRGGKQPGSAGFRISHAALGKGVVGEFTKPNTVILNIENTLIAHALKENNVLAGYVLAAGLLATTEALTGQQLLFRDKLSELDDARKFQARMCQLLTATIALDGRPLISSVPTAAE